MRLWRLLAEKCAFKRRWLHRIGPVLVLLAGMLILAGPSHAQVDRASLNGTIMDASNRVLPGVHVTATQNDTGLKRETVSSGTGRYEIADVPVGLYTVTFSLNGFEQLTFEKVEQVVGQTRTLNATLQISATKQTIEVAGTPPEVNQTSDSMGTRIEREQIEELPLNGRNWATLTELGPGAVDLGGSSQRTIRFAGKTPDDNNFTSDGVDATNIVNQPQQAFVRLAIPTDTIQEFRVETMLFTAETGATPGGQLAVTTAAGTNRFHGDVFEYLRNDVFDARNPFSVTSTPFRMNEYGGSFGGPVIKNKTFFYSSFEAIRQDLGQPLIGFVPTASFRAQVLAQSPTLASILNAYPTGQTAVNANVAQFTSEGSQIVNEASGMFRIDQHFTQNTTAFIRLNMDVAISDAPLASSGAELLDRQDASSRPSNVVVELLHVFSPDLVNESKLGFNRSTIIKANSAESDLPYSVAVPGFTTLNTNEATVGAGNSFSEIDNLTWVKGKHVLKFGAEVRRIQLNEGNGANGTIAYSSLANFIANSVSSATYSAALPVNGLRKIATYEYAQDEYKLKPNLTLNAGVRYSYFGIFHEVHNLANPFDFATCGPQGYCGVGASFGRPNTLDFDPRVAFAWAPKRLGGTTVIRGGAGIYHGDGQLDDQDFPVSNEVGRFSLSSATIPTLSYPITPFLSDTTGIISPKDENRVRKDMYVSQWGMSVEHTMAQKYVLTVSYVGDEGTHLLNRSYVNVINPLTGTRPFPTFGMIEFRGNGNSSDFNALQASVRRSFEHGFLVSFNYMYSHEIDDDSAGAGGVYAVFPQNVACQQCERASGADDVRHSGNANVVYELPFGAGKKYLGQPRIARDILGSWQLTSIVSARTGLPVNITVDRSSSALPDGNSGNQRPNLIPGASVIPTGGSTVGDWINLAAFSVPAAGTWGDLPRDFVRAPGAWQDDMGISRNFNVREHLGIQFRADVFNLFNHPEWGAPQSDISAGAGTFGRIISTLNTGPTGSGTPRQFQFGLRVKF